MTRLLLSRLQCRTAAAAGYSTEDVSSFAASVAAAAAISCRARQLRSQLALMSMLRALPLTPARLWSEYKPWAIPLLDEPGRAAGHNHAAVESINDIRV